VIENFREPDASLILGVTRGQFFSFFLIAIGLVFIVVAKLQPTFSKSQIARAKSQVPNPKSQGSSKFQ
jgi:prolipoprotein diacylglyceryltransferase